MALLKPISKKMPATVITTITIAIIPNSAGTSNLVNIIEMRNDTR
jgi:hypothetical protein